MHGFYNEGNTCYFNAALQCVLRVHDLSAHVLRNPYQGPCVFTTRYAELVRVYFQSQERLKIHVDPLLEAFRETFPRFTAREPHDAQEVIFCIVDILERTYPVLKTLVYGEREQTTVCPSGTKVVREPFSVLILPGISGTVSALVAASERWHTLTDYVDDAGKKHHVATTRSSIVAYPPVLFVSFAAKVNVVADELFGRYEVCGSVLHVNGHYTSMLKLGTTWFVQDDDIISGPVVFPEHHVLMYSLTVLESGPSPVQSALDPVVP